MRRPTLALILLAMTAGSANGQAAADPRCAVRGTKLLFPMAAGFSLSPKDENTVVFAKPDTAGNFQLYRRDIATGTERCITCASAPSGPSVKLHKAVPSFLPDGQHLIVQVEMASHPYQDTVRTPGFGWFYNIWMTTIDGSTWWQLTDYPHGADDRYGVLTPQVSPDGKKIAWGQLYRSDPRAQYAYTKGKFIPGGKPFGLWQLNIADLVFEQGAPRLRNIVSSRPGDGNFYEPQHWSPDSKTLLFAADIKRDTPHKIDIWALDIATGRANPLTDTDDVWEEFAAFSPSAERIAFMSTECCGWKPSASKKELQSELYLMDKNGKREKQITNFNRDGLRGIPADRFIPTGMRWSNDGKKLFFEMTLLTKRLKPRGTGLFELEFAGACGK